MKAQEKELLKASKKLEKAEAKLAKKQRME